MLPRLPDISDGTELKVRELSRRSRRSRDSNESIANLAIRLTNEAKLEPIAEASSTASMAASVMDTVSEALSGIERAMSRRASRESRDSQEERRKNSYDSKSKEGKRRRKSGEFNNEPTIMLDNLSGQRIMLFMQELQAELCDHCKKGNTAMVRAILDKDEALVPPGRRAFGRAHRGPRRSIGSGRDATGQSLRQRPVGYRDATCRSRGGHLKVRQRRRPTASFVGRLWASRHYKGKRRKPLIHLTPPLSLTHTHTPLIVRFPAPLRAPSSCSRTARRSTRTLRVTHQPTTLVSLGSRRLLRSLRR